MANINLTIAIPTFNRAKYLDALLKSLVDQAEYIDHIEILICDNASSDITYAIADNFASKFSFVHYHRNEQNIGLDANVYTAYSLAKGKYVWFLCDDDKIVENSIELVLNAIAETTPYVLTMGSRHMDDTNDLDDAQQDAVYHSWATKSSAQDFMSVIMLPRLIVRKIDLDIERLLSLPSTIFPQVTLCLELLRVEFRLVLRKKVIIARLPGFTSRNFFELYCLGVRDAIRNANWKEAEACLLQATETALKEFVKLEILERAGVYLSKDRLPFATWKRGWDEFGGSQINRFRLITILLISISPQALAKLAYFLHLYKRSYSIRLAIISYKKNVDHSLDHRISDI